MDVHISRTSAELVHAMLSLFFGFWRNLTKGFYLTF